MVFIATSMRSKWQASSCHCEEQSDEAISDLFLPPHENRDCFAALAMTTFSAIALVQDFEQKSRMW